MATKELSNVLVAYRIVAGSAWARLLDGVDGALVTTIGSGGVVELCSNHKWVLANLWDGASLAFERAKHYAGNRMVANQKTEADQSSIRKTRRGGEQQEEEVEEEAGGTKNKNKKRKKKLSIHITHTYTLRTC